MRGAAAAAGERERAPAAPRAARAHRGAARARGSARAPRCELCSAPSAPHTVAAAPGADHAHGRPDIHRCVPRDQRRDMDFQPSERCAEFKERLTAFMDEHVYPAEEVYERELLRVRRSAPPAGDHGGAEEARPRRRPVEHVPARRAARRRAVQQRLRAARGDPRALAHRLGGVQLLGAGHRQHGGAAPVRHARAEGALAGAAARRRDPLGVRDDRARRRQLRRDQRRSCASSATATTTCSTGASGGPPTRCTRTAGS